MDWIPLSLNWTRRQVLDLHLTVSDRHLVQRAKTRARLKRAVSTAWASASQHQLFAQVICFWSATLLANVAVTFHFRRHNIRNSVQFAICTVLFTAHSSEWERKKRKTNRVPNNCILIVGSLKLCNFCSLYLQLLKCALLVHRELCAGIRTKCWGGCCQHMSICNFPFFLG